MRLFSGQRIGRHLFGLQQVTQSQQAKARGAVLQKLTLGEIHRVVIRVAAFGSISLLAQIHELIGHEERLAIEAPGSGLAGLRIRVV